LSLITRDIVWVETPAIFAISFIVTRRFLFIIFSVTVHVTANIISQKGIGSQ
jgi:hypothetical protein